jgi:hypothetical protein
MQASAEMGSGDTIIDETDPLGIARHDRSAAYGCSSLASVGTSHP